MIKKFIFFLLFSFGLAFGIEQAEDELLLCSPTNCYFIQETIKETYFTLIYSVEDAFGQRYVIKSNPCPPGAVWVNVEQEHAISQNFDHPNIIKSIELFSNNGSSGEEKKYLVLEFVSGKTLASFGYNSLSKSAALQLCIQFVQALNYALEQGFVHADMHENNFMINENLELKMIDLASFKRCRYENWDGYLKQVLFICQEILEKSSFKNREIKLISRKFKQIKKKYPEINKQSFQKCLGEVAQFLGKSN